MLKQLNNTSFSKPVFLVIFVIRKMPVKNFEMCDNICVYVHVIDNGHSEARKYFILRLEATWNIIFFKNDLFGLRNFVL